MLKLRVKREKEMRGDGKHQREKRCGRLLHVRSKNNSRKKKHSGECWVRWKKKAREDQVRRCGELHRKAIDLWPKSNDYRYVVVASPSETVSNQPNKKSRYAGSL
jgi:hypothetical protein